MPISEWIKLGLSIATNVILLSFLVGKWVQKTDTKGPVDTPPPTNMNDCARIESEQKRMRDRLHVLEGWKQGVHREFDERYPTRREYVKDQEEFRRVRELIETVTRRENHH